jgi:hypothetical protein
MRVSRFQEAPDFIFGDKAKSPWSWTLPRIRDELLRLLPTSKQLTVFLLPRKIDKPKPSVPTAAIGKCPPLSITKARPTKYFLFFIPFHYFPLQNLIFS